jgi:hypothetical protein
VVFIREGDFEIVKEDFTKINEELMYSLND